MKANKCGNIAYMQTIDSVFYYTTVIEIDMHLLRSFAVLRVDRPTIKIGSDALRYPPVRPSVCALHRVC